MQEVHPLIKCSEILLPDYIILQCITDDEVLMFWRLGCGSR